MSNLLLTITAYSTPDYDDWGPDTYWDCYDWMTWHQKMVPVFGLDEANRRFIEAFHNAGQFSNNFDCRSFNSDFRDYAKQNGFYEALYAGLAGLIVKPIGWGTDAVSTAGSAINIVKSVVPLLLIATVIFLLIYGARKSLA